MQCRNSIKYFGLLLKSKTGNLLIIPYQLTKFQTPSSNLAHKDDSMIGNFAKFYCALKNCPSIYIIVVRMRSLSFVCKGCHGCRFEVSIAMRFTLHGALQGDVIRKRISYFQRQSYILSCFQGISDNSYQP